MGPVHWLGWWDLMRIASQELLEILWLSILLCMITTRRNKARIPTQCDNQNGRGGQGDGFKPMKQLGAAERQTTETVDRTALMTGTRLPE